MKHTKLNHHPGGISPLLHLTIIFADKLFLSKDSREWMKILGKKKIWKMIYPSARTIFMLLMLMYLASKKGKAMSMIRYIAAK